MRGWKSLKRGCPRNWSGTSGRGLRTSIDGSGSCLGRTGRRRGRQGIERVGRLALESLHRLPHQLGDLEDHVELAVVSSADLAGDGADRSVQPEVAGVV